MRQELWPWGLAVRRGTSFWNRSTRKKDFRGERFRDCVSDIFPFFSVRELHYSITYSAEPNLARDLDSAALDQASLQHLEAKSDEEVTRIRWHVTWAAARRNLVLCSGIGNVKSLFLVTFSPVWRMIFLATSSFSRAYLPAACDTIQYTLAQCQLHFEILIILFSFVHLLFP